MLKNLKPGTHLVGIERCIYCGIATPLYISRAEWGTNHILWRMYECQSCKNIITAKLIDTLESKTLGLSKYIVGEIFPKQKEVSEELPQQAKRYLSQAISSIHAPDGAVMLAGSAVDAILKGKGYETESVFKRIEKAVKDGVLTSDMAEWAHDVRLDSNKPRHADSKSPHMTEMDAKRVIEFTEMLGHILYTLPKQVEVGKNKASRTNDKLNND